MVLGNAGDLTGYNYSGMADPIFGSPNPRQMPLVAKERKAPPAPEQFLPALLAFSTLWTQSIALMCHGRKIPFVLINDSSFFEKREPSERDIECELGVPYQLGDKRWFEGHKASAEQFFDRREALAAKLEFPLAGPGRSNDFGFIDEFHFDEDGTRAITDDVTAALKGLLMA